MPGYAQDVVLNVVGCSGRGTVEPCRARYLKQEKPKKRVSPAFRRVLPHDPNPSKLHVCLPRASDNLLSGFFVHEKRKKVARRTHIMRISGV